MLCIICLKIRFKWRSGVGDAGVPDNDDPRTFSYVHHDSLRKLKASAASGCHLCEMMWQRWLVAVLGDQGTESFTGPITLRRVWPSEQIVWSREFDRKSLNITESFTMWCGEKRLQRWGWSVDVREMPGLYSRRVYIFLGTSRLTEKKCV